MAVPWMVIPLPIETRTSLEPSRRSGLCQRSILAEDFGISKGRSSQPSSAAQTTGRPSSASHRVLHAATLLRCYRGFLRFDFAMFAAALSSVREKRCNSKGVVAEPWRADRQGAWTGLPPVRISVKQFADVAVATKREGHYQQR